MKNNSDSENIPKDWEILRLGNESIADLIMGQSPPSSTYNYEGIGLPFLQGNADFGETYPTPILSCSQPIKIAEKNDILLSVRAPVGDVNISPSKSCIGRGLAAIRPKRDKLDHLFLFYYLKFGSRKFESLSMGSTFKAIRKEEVENFQIPLPPLHEQRRIAEVLGTVDSAIQKVGGAIESTERLKKGLMLRLLTRGIGHERFKESEVGRVPQEWEVVMLGDVVEELKNGFASGKRDENGIVQIRMNNVTTDGHLIFDSYLKVPVPENLNYWLLKKGDLLFNNTNSIDLVGKSTIFNEAPFSCTFSNHFTRIRFKKELVLSELILYHFLILWEKGYFKSVAIRHVGQSAVHTNYLLKLQITLPPLPEQRRIAEILSAADRKLELERRRKEKLERVKKGLMNELLTGRKRVKIALYL
ncbi:restriction endonuclease S subunits [groundwater metagenome]